jgi:hypothetical protein
MSKQQMDCNAVLGLFPDATKTASANPRGIIGAMIVLLSWMRIGADRRTIRD